MNEQDIYNGITDLGDDVLRETERIYKDWRGRFRVRLLFIMVVVLLAAGAVIGSSIGTTDGTSRAAAAYAVAQPEYPEGTVRGEEGYADSLDGFYADSIRQILSGTEGENKVYSPLNVYMALAMLAETTDGESRAQILNLLGQEDMAALRKQANTLWQANYRQDERTKSVLASSLWLNEDLDFDRHTLDILAEAYYASSYQGEMGSARYTKAFQSWLNAQTGNLLKEQAANLEFTDQTVMALAATVYYKAKWADEFDPEDTQTGVFHAETGDVEVPFMHQKLMDQYGRGENFSAVRQPMMDAGRSAMWYILPDEGVTVDDLLADDGVMKFILTRDEVEDPWQSELYWVDLAVPKFDVSSGTELSETMKGLGVTDVFDPETADFSTLTGTEPVWLSVLQHDVRVVADEEGIEAASYTVGMLLGSAGTDKSVEFVLDRPFLFVITGLDGLPLFVGVVNNP